MHLCFNSYCYFIFFNFVLLQLKLSINFILSNNIQQAFTSSSLSIDFIFSVMVYSNKDTTFSLLVCGRDYFIDYCINFYLNSIL